MGIKAFSSLYAYDEVLANLVSNRGILALDSQSETLIKRFPDF